MLRHLKDDIKNKSYAHRAKEMVGDDHDLLFKIRNALKKNKKEAGESIRSVFCRRGTLVIRASSYPAASELLTMKESILRTAKEEGATSVRFVV